MNEPTTYAEHIGQFAAELLKPAPQRAAEREQRSKRQILEQYQQVLKDAEKA